MTYLWHSQWSLPLSVDAVGNFDRSDWPWHFLWPCPWYIDIDTLCDLDLDKLGQTVWPWHSPWPRPCCCVTADHHLMMSARYSTATYSALPPQTSGFSKNTKSRDRKLRQARATPHARNGSRDIVDRVTNRFAICHFLLVVHWSRASLSHR